jgi:hypothetical protein
MKMKIVAALTIATALVGCGTVGGRQVTIGAQFDSKEAALMMLPGNNTITGSALVRQNGGGVVNCGGSRVTLLPATSYTIQRMTAIYGSQSYSNDRGVTFTQGTPDGYLENMRHSICNAAGFFTFDKVADGEYYVQSTVTWSVGYNQQGGALMRRVKVAGGETKEVTLAP